jgi:hypothetical protein
VKDWVKGKGGVGKYIVDITRASLDFLACYKIRTTASIISWLEDFAGVIFPHFVTKSETLCEFALLVTQAFSPNRDTKYWPKDNSQSPATIIPR